LVRVEQNPDVARWSIEREQRLADLALQRALGTLDVEAVGGIRWLGESSDNAVVLGLAVPLPVFDRNQGSSREAEYRVAQVEEEYRGALVAARTAIAVEFETIAAASEGLVILESEILPDAEAALLAADEAYQKGLFSLTDVLDTRRTLFELRGRRFDGLARYHQSVAEIERLIGEPVSAVGGPND
jgi:cobalt-zinc-cadmium efflux system outer membrane protein